MTDLRINVSDLPAEGREFSFADQEFWTTKFKEHALECAVHTPLEAEVQVQSLDNGALVRGTLKGRVLLPCDRCLDPFEFAVDVDFELLESLPGEDDPEGCERIVLENDIILLDMGALLWEEFVLALPIKPLCSEGCPGICPGCGRNLKEGSCDCVRDEGDPRLAVFRNLKLK
ncbi:MAG: DUF177 domain-containing protein [Desulfovibrionaceae bacterium]